MAVSTDTHLLTLINDILDLAKIEARKFELNSIPLHLPGFLQSVVEMCQIRAEQKGLDFIYQPNSRLPEGVLADEKRLRQVLVNLLGNAIKFTDQGSVTLQVDVVNLSETEVVLMFQSIDTGIGIAANEIPLLFQTFQQVGNPCKHTEGTGLGLAISQRMVRLMDSEIQVKSELGKGSEFGFTVALPVVQGWGQSKGAFESSGLVKGFEGQPRRILVIDDLWENRAVLVNLLEPYGFQLIEAQDGEEGLAKLRSQHPDLVITDLAMPVMDGYQFLLAVRQSTDLKTIPIIVSSASVSITDQKMALAQGGNAFLPKPVDANKLIELITDCLNLTWVKSEEASLPAEESLGKVVLPPVSVVETLLGQVQQGDVKALRETIWALTASNNIYLPFAQPILELARQFRVEEIASLLQLHTSTGSRHEK